MILFEFVGFEPRAGFRRSCNEWLSRMVERAPSDAFCKASVEKVPNGYLFKIRIHSSSARFSAESLLDETKADRSDRDWQNVGLLDLDRQITEQLKTWRLGHGKVSHQSVKKQAA